MELDVDLILERQDGALSSLKPNMDRVSIDTFLLFQYYQDVVDQIKKRGREGGRGREQHLCAETIPCVLYLPKFIRGLKPVLCL